MKNTLYVISLIFCLAVSSAKGAGYPGAGGIIYYPAGGGLSSNAVYNMIITYGVNPTNGLTSNQVYAIASALTVVKADTNTPSIYDPTFYNIGAQSTFLTSKDQPSVYISAGVTNEVWVALGVNDDGTVWQFGIETNGTVRLRLFGGDPYAYQWDPSLSRFTVAGNARIDTDLSVGDGIIAQTIEGVHKSSDGSTGSTVTTGDLVFKDGVYISGTLLSSLATNAFLYKGVDGNITTGIFGANLSFDPDTKTLSATGGSGGDYIASVNGITTNLTLRGFTLASNISAIGPSGVLSINAPATFSLLANDIILRATNNTIVYGTASFLDPVSFYHGKLSLWGTNWITASDQLLFRATNGIQFIPIVSGEAILGNGTKENYGNLQITGYGNLFVNSNANVNNLVVSNTAYFNELVVNKYIITNDVFASASTVVLNVSNYSAFALTNELAHNISIGLTNFNRGNEVIIFGHGATSGGSDYTVTINDFHGSYVRWVSPTNGATTFTATNGQSWEVSMRKSQMNTSNIITAVLGRFK